MISTFKDELKVAATNKQVSADQLALSDDGNRLKIKGNQDVTEAVSRLTLKYRC